MNGIILVKRKEKRNCFISFITERYLLAQRHLKSPFQLLTLPSSFPLLPPSPYLITTAATHNNSPANQPLKKLENINFKLAKLLMRRRESASAAIFKKCFYFCLLAALKIKIGCSCFDLFFKPSRVANCFFSQSF